MTNLETTINFYETRIPIDVLEEIQREIFTSDIPDIEKEIIYVGALIEGYKTYLKELEEYVQGK